MKKILITCLLLTVLSRTQAARPNFVVIFTDDQGYGDLGCFGGKHVNTPACTRRNEADQFLRGGPGLHPFPRGVDDWLLSETGEYGDRIEFHRGLGR